MAWTTDDLAAIDEAIASGQLTIEQGDRKMTYRSMAELMQARSMIADSLAGTGNNASMASKIAFHRGRS